MTTQTIADKQSQALQNKLNAAIAARSSLEEDFKAQSSLLIDFISKLSQLSKGMDLTIDNRLAQLRVLLTKSAPIADIELKITEISKLLQQHTRTNEKNINHIVLFEHSGNRTEIDVQLTALKTLPEAVRARLH